MKIDHFQKIISKILAMWANDRQFYPELRTVYPISANSLDFSALRFQVPKNPRGDPLMKKI